MNTKGLSLGFDTSVGVSDREGSLSGLKNLYINTERESPRLEIIPGYRRLLKLKEAPEGVILREGSEADEIIFILSDGAYSLKLSESKGELTKLPHLSESKEIIKPCHLNCEERLTKPCYLGGEERLSKLCNLGEGERLINIGSRLFISDGEALAEIKADGTTKAVSLDPRISGCTLGTVNRERLLLTANPKSPGLIFFSEGCCGDISFKDGDLFTDGFGMGNIEHLISFGGLIWLFKDVDEGDGRISCYSLGDDGKAHRAYTINSSKILSAPLIYRGELLVLCEEGLLSITPSSSEAGGFISRILKIYRPLPDSKNGKIRLGVWCGYLALAQGEKILLLRQKGNTFDSFLISDVVGYSQDEQVYRYSNEADEGLLTHPKPDSVAEGVIMSKMTDCGKMIYYSKEEDKCYSVYPTRERRGGERLIPSEYIFLSDKMLFITDDGSVYIFNNDKIPCPVGDEKSSIKACSHRSENAPYYSFAGHPIKCEAVGVLKGLHLLGGESDRAEVCANLELYTEGNASITLSLVSGGRVVGKRLCRPLDSKKGSESKGFSLKARLPCKMGAKLRLEGEIFSSFFSLGDLSVQAKKG